MLDFLKIDPVAFTIPIGNGFPVYWYGIIITVGIVLGAWWAGREIEKRGQSVDDLYNGLLLVVLFGYLFARLWYVFQDAIIAGNRAAYTSFLDVINIRAGGANILGGFVSAALVGFLYIRWRKLNFWDYADVAGPALLLAQAIGRWGNFINQELYGPPTKLPWGILIDNRIPPYNDLALYPPDTRFHPTFLYESIWLFIGFFLLTYLNRRFRASGRRVHFSAFLIWWGGGRAWIELFRPDQPAIGNSLITYSMLLALGLAVVGALIIMGRYGKLALPPRRKPRVRKPKPRRQQSR